VEKEPLESFARDGEFMTYRHCSFWYCMEQLHKKLILKRLWQTGKASKKNCDAGGI